MRLSIIFYIVIFSFTLFPAISFAQIGNLQTAGQIEPEINTQPAFPKPNDLIEVTILNVGRNLDGANITWFLNKVEIPETKNSKRFKVDLGEGSSPKTLTAFFNLPNGSTFSMSKTITPLNLDLIIEPQTHVPEFYLGRSLPSIGSIVNVTAIVSGEEILNSDLIYTWRINRVIPEGNSVRGQNKISFEIPRGNQSVLSLEVSNLSGRKIAERSILLPSVQPEIKFYESNLLFGLKQKPIKNVLSLVGNTSVVRAEPYYLDSRVYNQPDILEWEIDNNTYQNIGGNPYEVTLQRVGLSGRSSLNIHVRSTEQLLQGARGSIEVNI